MKKILTLVLLCIICCPMWGQELFSKEGSNGKFGYVNNAGEIVIPYQYDWGDDFSDGLAVVRLNGLYGCIDGKGIEVILCQYDDIGAFSDGLAKAKLIGKYGYINKKGEEVVPCQYDEIKSFSDGLAKAKLIGKYGYVNKKGEEVIPCQYDEIKSFSDGLAKVKRAERYGYVDKGGKEVIPCQYDEIKSFSEGLARVKRKGKYGYVDKSGKEVIPCQYDEIKDFSEGVALVKLKGKYGYVDKNGKEIISCQYDNANSFSDGLAQVKRNREYGYIDKHNHWYRTKEVGQFVLIKYPELKKVPSIVAPSVKWDMASTEFPLLNIVPNSIRFVDATGDNAIGANEACKITFQVSNTGKGVGRNCVAKVTTTATGVTVADKQLSTIPVGSTVTVEIPIIASMNTITGQADFTVTVDEPNGLGCDPITLAVATKAFESPMLKITDYAVLGTSNGMIAKRTPFDLQLLLQNVEYGNAEDVEVEVSIPQNVLIMEGSPKNSYASLRGGEKKSINYTLIANNHYTQSTIPVTVKIKEKYGRYAESRTVDLPIGQAIANTRIVIDAADDAPKGDITIAQIAGKVQAADVDINIPQGSTVNDKTFAVIIANENYQQESKVEYAQNDGAMFRQYCLQTLGLPEKNVHYVANATLNNMRYQLSWLTKVGNTYKGEARLIFYYAGHGVPDESTKSAYLLPVDGYGSHIESGYKLSDLYDELGAVPSTSTLVLLDACFSGAQRSGDMMASARAIAIEAKPETPKGGNMVVFSAAQGDETAYPYRGKNHGMFTYYLLKKLQETKGDVSLGELVEYVTENVGRRSIVENEKAQTPTVIPSAILQDSWESFRLK